MPIKVVLILGKSHVGKSTLVRCLSGLRRGTHRHPAEKNVVSLYWTDTGRAEKTLCLMSSLNEGKKYDAVARRNLADNANDAVSPLDLRALLDEYDRLPEETRCERAILCINTAESTSGWTVNDYEREIATWPQSSHTISHSVNFAEARVPLINLANATVVFALPRPATINQVAADVRPRIDLL